jgi:predicted dehydrogenase
MRDIGVGVIGTGSMGKAHSFAYRAVAGIFPGSLRPVLQSVADINGEAAEQAAKQFGFLRWRTDWRALVEDPDIEIVSITTPFIAKWRWRPSRRASTFTARSRSRQMPMPQET